MIQKPLFHQFDSPGAAGGDAILIEILEDGTIKITTDPISGPNHMSAEALLRLIAQEAGGTTTRARRVRTTTNSINQPLHGHLKS
jgi:hypothetical protein